MDTNLIERLTDGIFSKALQVRRMIQRGSAELMHLPLAEIVALSDRVEALYGDFERSPFTADSPEIIVVARKAP